MNEKILVIDDDPRILDLFERILGKRGFQVTSCKQAPRAIDLIKNENFDLILCDQLLGEMDGLQLLARSQEIVPTVPFIIITGHGSIPQAVISMKEGAFDYIVKPVNKETLLRAIKRALEKSSLHIDNKNTPLPVIGNSVIGPSEKMQELFRMISQISQTTVTVLIQGESGTGKEVIARAIHQLSSRKNNPFVVINCGALNDNLLENELFGHVKGAFTGAMRQKKGLVEEAHTGTLFLDEIGEIPLPMQTKLLRLLQEREFKPLGSNDSTQVDVRVLAATNVDLKEAVRCKRFREDLYYRLAVIPIFVPPLRERVEDIPMLAKHFANKYGEENHKKIEAITPKAIEKLVAYRWPGNVRELENTIARAVALSSNAKISGDLLWQGINETPVDTAHSLRDIIQRDTQTAIEKALVMSKGNRSEAARILGISRATLYHKLKKYELLHTHKVANSVLDRTDK